MLSEIQYRIYNIALNPAKYVWRFIILFLSFYIFISDIHPVLGMFGLFALIINIYLFWNDTGKP